MQKLKTLELKNEWLKIKTLEDEHQWLKNELLKLKTMEAELEAVLHKPTDNILTSDVLTHQQGGVNMSPGQ